MAPGLAADRGGVNLEQLTPSALIKKHYADAKADQARIAVSDAPLSEHIRWVAPDELVHEPALRRPTSLSKPCRRTRWKSDAHEGPKAYFAKPVFISMT